MSPSNMSGYFAGFKRHSISVSVISGRWSEATRVSGSLRTQQSVTWISGLV